MTLKGGRCLGYHEFGDPRGSPVIYIHGSPDSGVTLSGFEGQVAKRLGVRLIGPDRPGVGRSTFRPDLTMSRYPPDVMQLIEFLGLKEYSLLGTSGGTGFTLACAQQLPRENMKGIGICAGIGPWGAGLDGQSEAMKASMNAWKEYRDDMMVYMESLFLEAAQDPDPAKMRAAWTKMLSEGFPEEDKELLSRHDAFNSAVAVFRQFYCQGAAAHGKQMELITSPWDIDMDKIDYEGIKLWYGAEDQNTPPQMGRYLAERLPKAVYKEYSGKNHYGMWSEELLAEYLEDLLKVS